jgi:dTDP-4-amino-4,6-dideoxygalactose transaminase
MKAASQDQIPFALPSIGEEEEAAVLRVLRSGWLTTGREALAFEKEFAAALGVRHALAVNSATSGLHLAAEALGIGPGDKVITTPYTFTATAEVLRYLGADPVFADIDDDTLLLSPEKTVEAIRENPRVKAILPVHLAGRMADMARLSEIAEEYGLGIIEDAAHAFPVKGRQGPAGTIGSAGVFSFYATKTITTGEGGMVVTNDGAMAKRMSVMRLHGIDRDVWDRYSSSGGAWRYAVVEAGYKYNRPDLAAAIGRVQLRRAQAFKERRKAIADIYFRELAGEVAFRLPSGRGEDHAWHLFIMRVSGDDGGAGGMERDEVIRQLAARGIGSSVHYISLHLMPYYRDRYGLEAGQFPVAAKASESCFSLPIFPSMTDNQVYRVVEAVRDIARRKKLEGRIG